MIDLRVSVIIPCFNYGRFLAEAVESVLAQTRPAHEIIVVDDGSTDDTPQVATRFGERVRYLRTENRGVCAARNAGIAIAAGGLIAFLDADDRWLPTKLERQVPLFAGDPDIGLVHAGSRVVDGRTGETRCFTDARARLGLHDLLECCAVSMPSAVVPRHLLDEVGKFDESLKHAGDWDLWIRIASRYAVVGCPETLVDYREHSGSLSHGNLRAHFRACQQVLAKAARIHGDCPRCHSAIRSALERLAEEYFGQVSAQARASFRSGDVVDGVRLRIHGIRSYPKVLRKLPQILTRRLREGVSSHVQRREA